MEMFHINRESDAFENPMQGISLHCIAVTESLSYCVHHYSRSTSAGIFMARLHTTAISCSCHVLGSTSTLIFISAIDVRPSLNVHSILVLSSWWVFLTSFTFNADHTQRSLIHFRFIGVIQMNLKGHSTQN